GGISGATHVRYYPTGTTNYKYKYSATNTATLKFLYPGTTYSWDLNNFCNGQWTTYSGSGAFTTLADTVPLPTCIPTGLTATNATAHTVDLSWGGISGATHVRYYPTGTTNYKYKCTLGNTATLTCLLPGTAYTWDLNNFCNGFWTPYTGNGNFTTISDMYKSAVVDANAPESEDLTELIVFPNPVKEKTIITFNSGNNNVYSYKIIDVTGRELKTITNQATTGANRFEVDLTGRPKGFYLLYIQKGDELKHVKLLKE
ncbi:MAG: T9SS type A sorting domain-containing protein, partial [Bacteroidota bacterium]